jgi:hypothetical protein
VSTTYRSQDIISQNIIMVVSFLLALFGPLIIVAQIRLMALIRTLVVDDVARFIVEHIR